MNNSIALDNDSIASSSSDNQPLLIQDVDAKIVGDSTLTNFPRLFDGHENSRENKHGKLKILSILLLLICVALAVTLVIVAWRNNPTKNESKTKRASDVEMKDIVHFFLLSDLHLDLYYQQNVTNQNKQMCRNINIKGKHSIEYLNSTAVYGRIECDSPETLVKSTVDQMKKLNSDKDKLKFILITGDLAAHGYGKFDVDEKDSTIWSIGNVTKLLSDVQKDVAIFPAMGNNDNYVNYQPPVTNQIELYERVANVIEPYIFTKNVSQDNSIGNFRKTFYYGGYYSIKLNDEKLMIIVLNTNYWNTKAYSINEKIITIGDAQLKWLYEQLVDANNTGFKVLITGHIPPGFDTYDGELLWLDRIINIYTFQLSQFQTIVAGQLFGHVHTDKFRVLFVNDQFSPYYTNGLKSSVFITPSITPIYKNSPTFRLFLLDNTKHEIVDYLQYYMDLPASNVMRESIWKLEYSFQSLYNKTVSSDSINELIEELRNTSINTWEKYMRNLKTNYGGTMLSERYSEYCATKHIFVVAYKDCMEYYIDANK